MRPFVHLHNHTAYSLLDGASKIGEMIERAKELNQPALAITDHGVMYGVVDFYKACKKAGVKPIIGCEVYVAPRTRFDKQAG
ncbi:MAG: PHP domain-containing protein, partial [Peptococcaceae bacterium]|nr:PHP domain-containing protein [Peptococcaceae bacterium]